MALGLALGSCAVAAPVSLYGVVGGGSGSGAHGPQGYLGIDVRDVSEENVSVLKLRDTRGAEIIRVDHDGPAGKMGLREHDVVLQMNGVLVDGEEQIRRMLRETAPGRPVALVIVREGRQLTVSGVMADQAEVAREAWERHLSPPSQPGGPQAPANALPTGDTSLTASNAGSGGTTANVPAGRYGRSFLGTFLTSPTYTGVLLEAMGPQLAQFFAIPGGGGLLVRNVDANSPAAMAGIRAGDVVLRANQQPVRSPSQWAKMIRDAKGRPVLVTVMRDHQEQTFTLIADTKKRSSLSGEPLEDLPAGRAEPVGAARAVFYWGADGPDGAAGRLY